jgi:hypothetical protein
MPNIPTLLWKIPIVICVTVLGTMFANQAGWSGADLLLNADLMGLFVHISAAALFFVSLALCFGGIVLIKRIAKPMLWIVLPVFLYAAVLSGAWNGFASDFDTTRAAVIQHGYANAYALEHMSPRGRYRSCDDRRIRLTDDAKAVCDRVMKSSPGEIIPGSEHRCGLFRILVCYDASPKK